MNPLDLLKPLEYAVAWILVTAHDGLTAVGLPSASGWTWVAAIVCMVMVIRSILIPLFVYQIRASRRLQLAQPHMRKISAKYKGKKDMASQQAMRAEMSEVYREHGNPLSSCLPMLAQMPIFYALFRVLSGVDDIARGTKDPISRLTQEVATEMDASSFLGTQLSDTFRNSDDIATKLVALVLIVLMTGSQFYSMRQTMVLNTPDDAKDNPMMQNQKILLYVFPVVFAVTGFAFPIGMLVYWFVSNIWTTVQQFYVLRQMPAPGSEAERRLNERRAKKGLPPYKNGKIVEPEGGVLTQSREDAEPLVEQGKQRQQPKKSTKRARRKR